jgi:integrase
VADLVRFQRLTGCRPTEACSVRPSDIERGGEVWIYRPLSHKTEHHGRERAIPIGPEAQRVLTPYLLRAADAYCFSPTDSERQRRAQRHAERTTPKKQGNKPGSNRVRSPKRRAGPRYTKDSYNQAITRACKLAEVPKWTPNQLRHARATEIRKALAGGDAGLAGALPRQRDPNLRRTRPDQSHRSRQSPGVIAAERNLPRTERLPSPPPAGVAP